MWRPGRASHPVRADLLAVSPPSSHLPRFTAPPAADWIPTAAAARRAAATAAASWSFKVEGDGADGGAVAAAAAAAAAAGGVGAVGLGGTGAGDGAAGCWDAGTKWLASGCDVVPRTLALISRKAAMRSPNAPAELVAEPDASGGGGGTVA